MNIPKLFASILMSCWLAVSFLGVASVLNSATAGQSLVTIGKSTKNKRVAVKRRGSGQQRILPIVPYIAYDYPYYYSRGFYPTHIGPGYIYKHDLVTNGRRLGSARSTHVSHSAIERCSRRFQSFERDTGLYTTYRGKKKLCPYLR